MQLTCLDTPRTHYFSQLACTPHRRALSRPPQHRCRTAADTQPSVAEGLIANMPAIDTNSLTKLLGEETMSEKRVKNEGGEIVYVDAGFVAEEGGRLGEDYVIGKLLGGGFQGAVYLLDHADKGKPDCQQLLKVVRAKYARPITGADTGLKREWIIGQALNKLDTEDGAQNGFMGTGAAVVRRDGNVLEGLVLEKVNGMPLEKRLWKDDTFADAPYTLEMLKQVFKALDRADRQLGLMHNDCRVANIMEHRPESDDVYVPRGFKKRTKEDRRKLRELQKRGPKGSPNFMLPGDEKPKALQFKIIDYGHAILPNHPRLPEPPIAEYFYRRMFYKKHDAWRLLQDLSDAIDGRTWPAQDKPTVTLLQHAVESVTGVRLFAFYEGPNSPQVGGLPWLAMVTWRSSSSPLHILRRQFIKWKAYIAPVLPQASAGEVLALLEGDDGPLNKHREEEQNRVWNNFNTRRTL